MGNFDNPQINCIKHFRCIFTSDCRGEVPLIDFGQLRQFALIRRIQSLWRRIGNKKCKRAVELRGKFDMILIINAIIII